MSPYHAQSARSCAVPGAVAEPWPLPARYCAMWDMAPACTGQYNVSHTVPRTSYRHRAVLPVSATVGLVSASRDVVVAGALLPCKGMRANRANVPRCRTNCLAHCLLTGGSSS